MAKKESTLLQLILSLTLIAIVAAVALAAVYTVTKEPIEASQNSKKNDAIQLVLPDFDGKVQDMEMAAAEGEQPVLLHMAYDKKGDLYGAAVETYTNIAYSGSFTIMVGFDAEGTITGTEVLLMNETPGLGDKIDKSKSSFPEQFVGKNPGQSSIQVKNDGGDIDAITAATISSRAFCDAVNRAYTAFLKAKEVKK